MGPNLTLSYSTPTDIVTLATYNDNDIAPDVPNK